MAKETTSAEPHKAMLIIDKKEFKHQLEEQIQKGKELLTIQVARKSTYNQPVYRRGYAGAHETLSSRQYEDEQYELFRQKFLKWKDYNRELLKQAFDIPNNEYQTAFEWKGHVDVIFGNEDVMKIHHDEIKEKITYFESLVDKLPLLPTTIQITSNKVAKTQHSNSKKVFIVHGHDTNVRNEVELFVRSIGYDPIILCKRADKGDTIIEKIEREAKDVCFAIVIYTSCDLGKDKNEDNLKPRARQNVVFEHGFMCAHLGRANVCALLEDNVEQPGDLQGVIYKPLDIAGAWKYQIADEMKAIGLDVDKNLIK